jgi:hypothetical protein
VAGAETVANAANSGIVTAVFPATASITDTDVVFQGAVQTGGTSCTTASTGFTLYFDKDPLTLTADNIRITGATKGALTGSGTTRNIAITNITVVNGETVSVTITSPSGYSISGSPKTAVVYRAPISVNFTGASQTGGTSGVADSTGLILTFSADPTTLSVDDITVTGATKGALSGAGTTRTLAILNIAVANGTTVSVSITNPAGYSISGSPKTAVVYRAPISVNFTGASQAGGTSGAVDSTGLILTFSADPTTLSADDITVTRATKGALSGAGTTRTLAISDIAVANGDNVTVTITSPAGYSISGSPQTAVVYKAPATCTIEGVTFKMLPVPGGKTFPTGVNDDGTATVAGAYWVGETEVTYELWNKVYAWATTGTTGTGAGQYTFANEGMAGSEDSTGTDQQPVTHICWRDSMVWCNALTEWYNAKKGTSYECVYTYSGVIIRDSRATNAVICDTVAASSTARGFACLQPMNMNRPRGTVMAFSGLMATM